MLTDDIRTVGNVEHRSKSSQIMSKELTLKLPKAAKVNMQIMERQTGYVVSIG